MASDRRRRPDGACAPEDTRVARPDLVAVAEAALRWLAAQDEFFSPPATALSPGAAKPVVELAIMLYRLTAPGRGPLVAGDPAVVTLVDLVEAVGHRPDVRSRPVASTSDVLLHAVICAVLERAGRPAAEHRDVVRRAVGAGVVDHAERLPYQMLEERLLLDWGGFRHSLPERAELAARSLLAGPLRALMLTERTAYQLTHDVMFLAGLDPGSGVPPELVGPGAARRTLADLLVSFAGASHWDLLGELLLSWDCLHHPRDWRYECAWDLLLSQQAVDGSFPGPPPRPGAEPDPAEGAARFRHRYHTTLVVLLAIDGRVRRAVSSPHPSVRPGRVPAGAASAAPADRAAAVQRDAGWLRALLDHPAGAVPPAVAGGVLVGIWLCAAVDPEIRSMLPAVARHAARRLASASGFEAAPLALTLTAHAVLSRAGQPAPALAAFVERVSAVLAAQPLTSAVADLALCEKRILLQQLGLGPQPLLMSVVQARSTIDGLTLQPAPDRLALAQLAAESATGFGTVATEPSGADREAAETLASFAVREFRSADLATGCGLVRAANHLHRVPEDRSLEFTTHLLLQQRPEGGYGHLPSVPDLDTDFDVGDRRFDVDLDFHLPTTLTCLWTLAELHGSFRLYRSIRASPAREPPPGRWRRTEVDDAP